MEYESGVRDEGLVAAATRATYVDWLMHLRVDVVAEIELALRNIYSWCSRFARRQRVPRPFLGS